MQRQGQQAADQRVAHAVEIDGLVGHRGGDQRDMLHAVAGNAAGVRQQLLERDVLHALAHLVDQFREDLAHGGVPAKLALLDQHARQKRCHRLGVGADVKPVVDRDRRVGAEPPRADRAGSDDLAVFHDRRGDGRQFKAKEIGKEVAIQGNDVGGSLCHCWSRPQYRRRSHRGGERAGARHAREEARLHPTCAHRRYSEQKRLSGQRRLLPRLRVAQY
jgi:hypothetical protein